MLQSKGAESKIGQVEDETRESYQKNVTRAHTEDFNS